MLLESLNATFELRNENNVPLLLPASLKAASVRMMPKTSCERMVLILPWVGSGLWMVRREPEAVTICCSLVPANCPSIAWVMEVGGWMVSEYMNIDEVVAMLGSCEPEGDRRSIYSSRQTPK